MAKPKKAKGAKAKKPSKALVPKKETRGRKSPYNSKTHDQLAFQHALLGTTDAMLAQLLGISVETIYNWKNDHPSFAEALNNGREKADSVVAAALYNRAIGMSYTEEVAIKVKLGSDERGKPIETVQVVRVERTIPPDPSSCFFWLKNRHRVRWRDGDRKPEQPEDGQADAIQKEAEALQIADAIINRLSAITARSARKIESQQAEVVDATQS